MRTPLTLLAALLLAACQTSSGERIADLPSSDPTADSTGLADAPQMGSSASGATTASGER